MVSREVPQPHDNLFTWHAQIFQNEKASSGLCPTKDYSILAVLEDLFI